MTVHEWVTRMYCPLCHGYTWTNPGAQSVSCACGASYIDHDVITLKGEEVTDEEAFFAAVALDIGVADDVLDLRKVDA